MVKHDDYMTPFSAWEDVSAYIPRHLTLWEAFYGDGTSGAHLAELGFDVIHEDVDFFEHDLGECVVTNPPFSELPRVLARLRELQTFRRDRADPRNTRELVLGRLYTSRTRADKSSREPIVTEFHRRNGTNYTHNL